MTLKSREVEENLTIKIVLDSGKAISLTREQAMKSRFL